MVFIRRSSNSRGAGSGDGAISQTQRDLSASLDNGVVSEISAAQRGLANSIDSGVPEQVNQTQRDLSSSLGYDGDLRVGGGMGAGTIGDINQARRRLSAGASRRPMSIDSFDQPY